MWISRERFVELVRAEERAELFRLRVNQLEHDLAQERHRATGQPQRVAFYENPHQRAPKPDATPEQQSIAQIEQGLAIFNDMGDDEANKSGLHTDEEGRLIGV